MYEGRRHYLSNSFKNANTIMEKDGEEPLSLENTKGTQQPSAAHVLGSDSVPKGDNLCFLLSEGCYWDDWRNVQGSEDQNVVLCQCYCPDFVISTVMIV